MTALGIIGWWERRRVFYNFVVGCTRIVCCVLVATCAVVSGLAIREPIGIPDGPLLALFAMIFYGIIANVCYTGGWICELLLRSMLTKERATAYALRSFRLAIQFSVALTLLPAAICWIGFVVMLITGYRPQAGPE